MHLFVACTGSMAVWQNGARVICDRNVVAGSFSRRQPPIRNAQRAAGAERANGGKRPVRFRVAISGKRPFVQVTR